MATGWQVINGFNLAPWATPEDIAYAKSHSISSTGSAASQNWGADNPAPVIVAPPTPIIDKSSPLGKLTTGVGGVTGGAGVSGAGTTQYGGVPSGQTHTWDSGNISISTPGGMVNLGTPTGTNVPAGTAHTFPGTVGQYSGVPAGNTHTLLGAVAQYSGVPAGAGPAYAPGTTPTVTNTGLMGSIGAQTVEGIYGGVPPAATGGATPRGGGTTGETAIDRYHPLSGTEDYNGIAATQWAETFMWAMNQGYLPGQITQAEAPVIARYIFGGGNYSQNTANATAQSMAVQQQAETATAYWLWQNGYRWDQQTLSWFRVAEPNPVTSGNYAGGYGGGGYGGGGGGGGGGYASNPYGFTMGLVNWRI